ncbi:MAG: formyltransferase family protein [Hyphomicrobiales bacterium]|nr:formyltransferase family protein [Hyphomicrobiales bacterium]
MSEPTEVPGKPLKAVFFVDLRATTGPMIRAWLESGHLVTAVVIYRQKLPHPLAQPVRWLALQWSILRLLRRRAIPIVKPSAPLDWAKLSATLAKKSPDVAITYGFMRRVPQTIREIFPKGSLNFHPALLPHYRGPQPLHWLAIHDAWRDFGGVTLHEMTDGFDEGAIVAQAAMADLPKPAGDPATFLIDALATMTREVIPRYCAGEITAWPQPAGEYFYARGDYPEQIVQPQWTRDYLRALCAIIRKRPGVTISIFGKRVRLQGEAGVIGPPDGRPASMKLNSVEFDLADCRVRYRRRTPFNRVINFIDGLPRRFRRSYRKLPIRLGPFASTGAKAD